MIRNAKVRTKILLNIVMAFVPLVLIVCIVAGTSLENIRNMEHVGKLASLNELYLSLEYNFMETRIAANHFYPVTSDEKLAYFTTTCDTVEELFAEITAQTSQSDEHVSRYATQVSELHSTFMAWRDLITQFESNIRELAILREDIGRVSQVISEEMYGRDAWFQEAPELVSQIESAIRRTTQAILSDRYTNANALITDINTLSNLVLLRTNRPDAPALSDLLSQFGQTFQSYAPDYLRANQNLDTARDMGTNAQKMMDAIVRDMQNTSLSLIEETRQTAQNALIIIVAIAFAEVILGIAFSLHTMKSFTVPIAHLSKTFDIVRTTGRMELTEQERAQFAECETKDEIGQSIRAFCKMMDRIAGFSDIITSISHGDLTMTVTPLSDQDTVGIALSTMVRSLNKTFEQINEVAGLVAEGAAIVAEGAQSMAQGAMEQSATVEQISVSATQIAQQTNNHALSAERMRLMGDDIAHIATQGTEQMARMIESVEGIRTANRTIAHAVDIIDELSFTTNVLSINAAVEAAHAGQYARGFSVVASEVRGLAGQAAQAARQIGDLIEESIKRSDQGATIAQGTEDMLTRIAKGIHESSTLLSDIARSSSEQAQAIAQISAAIDHVSVVVHNNSQSATLGSEQSERMNAQAETLRKLIGQFTLKKD